jgi:hypothetical protein
MVRGAECCNTVNRLSYAPGRSRDRLMELKDNEEDEDAFT